jgi:hypothetical protein
MTVDKWPTNDQSHEWDVSAKSFKSWDELGGAVSIW